MSPAELSTTLQENFVKTEIDTGLKMIAQATRQRAQRHVSRALESLGLARLALSGAEGHMAAVTLPESVVKRMKRHAGRLRRSIKAFEAGEGVRPTA